MNARSRNVIGTASGTDISGTACNSASRTSARRMTSSRASGCADADGMRTRRRQFLGWKPTSWLRSGMQACRHAKHPVPCTPYAGERSSWNIGWRLYPRSKMAMTSARSSGLLLAPCLTILGHDQLPAVPGLELPGWSRPPPASETCRSTRHRVGDYAATPTPFRTSPAARQTYLFSPPAVPPRAASGIHRARGIV